MKFVGHYTGIDGFMSMALNLPGNLWGINNFGVFLGLGLCNAILGGMPGEIILGQ